MPQLDMVRSHVETLIEQLVGVDKARSDGDGDYPIRYRDAAYYIRVVNDRVPVVQVFSTAVVDIECSDALLRALNEINSHLHFCRTFWVAGQVLIESEHLGMTLEKDDFRECAENVAAASDHFGPLLVKEFGGKLAFENDKTESYEPPPLEQIGLYL